ncbi:MAG TPA: alpha/beta fold hydrolase [Solirubrobacterales bacterium]|nr:alpha/beta fold hydrolase [Solirubrobacterales bacterium]
MSGAGAAAAAPGDAPDREPLLLIHGLGASKSVWDPVVPHLEREREVIALDLPGFGAAPSLPAAVEPTALALAEALREELDARGTPRPHVAGNSLGAWVGLELGRIGAARSVVCLSPAGLWRGPIGPGDSRTREWARRLRPLVPLALELPSVRRRALATFAAHPERVPAAAGRELVLGWIDADGYEGANKAMREHVFDPAGYPPADEVAVTIAWAEHDRLVGPPKPGRRPAGARFVLMPGVGHTPTWDDPELVARVILEGGGGVGSGQTVTSEGGAS